MSDSAKQKVPGWFMVVAILALIWNLLGVVAFIAQVTMTPEVLAQLPQDQQDLYTAIPTWVTVAFAVAVNFGALGCLLLVLKNNLAGLFLQISLVAILVQIFYNFFIAKMFDVYGNAAIIMPIVTILIAVYLVSLAAKAKRLHWTT